MQPGYEEHPLQEYEMLPRTTSHSYFTSKPVWSLLKHKPTSKTMRSCALISNLRLHSYIYIHIYTHFCGVMCLSATPDQDLWGHAANSSFVAISCVMNLPARVQERAQALCQTKSMFYAAHFMTCFLFLKAHARMCSVEHAHPSPPQQPTYSYWPQVSQETACEWAHALFCVPTCFSTLPTVHHSPWAAAACPSSSSTQGPGCLTHLHVAHPTHAALALPRCVRAHLLASCLVPPPQACACTL